ncbi:MAG: U32 family peptidase [Gammaproteobacteria bacterium]
MLQLCFEKKIGMLFALSPRPEYDVKSSFYRSEFGLEQGRRINNNKAISDSIEEAIRLAELGCRGIIVYDIGVLRILSKMRTEGVLPSTLKFKASSHCMAANPMIAKILQENGADSITTIHDASLATLQEMRRICPGLILDVPTDVYAAKGGYIRFNELAEIVQIASPVMLKMGASAQNHPYDMVSDEIIHSRVKRIMVGLQHLNRIISQNQQMGNSCNMKCLSQV